MKRLLGFFKNFFFSSLASFFFFHREGASERFCRRWARLESPEHEFMVRRDRIWELPWRVEFCDLHRWDGVRSHWNGHDVGSGEGGTLLEAWDDMAAKIIEYEGASSKEEALLKAELWHRSLRKRGWGEEEWRKYYESEDF